MQNRSVILLVIVILTMIVVGWIVQLGGGVRQPHSWRATVTLANSPPTPIARAGVDRLRDTPGAAVNYSASKAHRGFTIGCYNEAG